jgi:hypothetical protein
MKKKIVDLIMEELFKRIEEIKGVKENMRKEYIKLLIMDTFGIPFSSLPSETIKEIFNRLDEEIRIISDFS